MWPKTTTGRKGSSPMGKTTPLITYLEETTQDTPPPPPKTAKGFTTQNFREGDAIFTEGDVGEDAFLLKSGCVEISVTDNGEKLVLTQLGEQAIFGEMALILKGHKRTATATAVKNSQVVRIPKKIFAKHMKAAPAVISKCLIAIASRLDELTGKASLATPDLFESAARVFHLMQTHKQNNLLHDECIDTLVKLTSKSKAEIEETIEMMTAMNLVKITHPSRDHKRIFLIGRSRFLEKAMKIKELLHQYKDPGLKVSLPSNQDT
ncbi:MAG: cyclic nucleotide-binding domain-containing protein [Desulfobacterales bacterium]|nr:cyclic nucleotide-binding domain-containing protein [Desulfobacterales bacterium]